MRLNTLSPAEGSKHTSKRFVQVAAFVAALKVVKCLYIVVCLNLVLLHVKH